MLAARHDGDDDYAKIFLVLLILDNLKPKLMILSMSRLLVGLVWFVGFFGISTYVGYLTPNPCLCK